MHQIKLLPMQNSDKLFINQWVVHTNNISTFHPQQIGSKPCSLINHDNVAYLQECHHTSDMLKHKLRSPKNSKLFCTKLSGSRLLALNWLKKMIALST